MDVQAITAATLSKAPLCAVSACRRKSSQFVTPMACYGLPIRKFLAHTACRTKLWRQPTGVTFPVPGYTNSGAYSSPAHTKPGTAPGFLFCEIFTEMRLTAHGE